MPSNSRRGFLKAAAAAGVTVAAPLHAMAQRWREGTVGLADGFGPLRPASDEATGLTLLELPAGFRYHSVGWTGDQMDEGLRVPGAPDGMAAFAGPEGLVYLIRNHELPPGPAFAPALAYDRLAGGGTTTLTLDGDGRLRNLRASLSGTLHNRGGGPTPWRSWLTCEETVLDQAGKQGPLERPHGYVFDVPLDSAASTEPLVAMGRFVHEAVAVDPTSGVVYETEDARRAGLYRFIPDTLGRLAGGGRLQMLAARGRPRLNLRGAQPPGIAYGISWVDIEDPERVHDDVAARDGGGVFAQGFAAGGAIFARLEGAWYADGKVFITSTDGGAAGTGQVWELDIGGQELRLVFESPGADVLNLPDNLTVSPRGGWVLCENGTKNSCVHGLTPDGRLFRLARNIIQLAGERNGIAGDYTAGEFAGATFSPDGRWLFVNIQKPGITLAITGPWERVLI